MGENQAKRFDEESGLPFFDLRALRHGPRSGRIGVLAMDRLRHLPYTVFDVKESKRRSVGERGGPRKPDQSPPDAVVLAPDGCALGVQVRSTRRRRVDDKWLPPLPPIEEGHFREVKTGVLLLPGERIETSWIEVTLREGRNRQVRRMTAAVGLPTLRLIRAAIGPWALDGLGPGLWREEPVPGPRF